MTTHTKTALITGAAQRIGAQITRRLHSAGFNVVIHYGRSRSAAEAFCSELNAARGDSAIVYQAQLEQLDDLSSLVEQANLRWEGLDLLVNSASRFYPNTLAEASLESWQSLLQTNLRAPYFLSQAAAPMLKKRSGCILNIVDIYAERPLKGYSIYNISKAGIAMLTKSLALELGPEVRVNGISPGAILWPENAAELSDSAKEGILDKTALDRIGDPEDIASLVQYLALDAPYITGQIIAVDGGRTLNQ